MHTTTHSSCLLFLSCTSHLAARGDSHEFLLIQPSPVNRWNILRDTRKYFASVLTAMSGGWTGFVKRKFPDFCKLGDELSLTPYCILALNDIVITPARPEAVLVDLHSGHLSF